MQLLNILIFTIHLQLVCFIPFSLSSCQRLPIKLPVSIIKWQPVSKMHMGEERGGEGSTGERCITL